MPKQKHSPHLINVGLQQLYLGVSGCFAGALPSYRALSSVVGATGIRGESSPLTPHPEVIAGF